MRATPAECGEANCRQVSERVGADDGLAERLPAPEHEPATEGAAIRPEPGVAGSCSASRARRSRRWSGTAGPPTPGVVMDDRVGVASRAAQFPATA